MASSDGHQACRHAGTLSHSEGTAEHRGPSGLRGTGVLGVAERQRVKVPDKSQPNTSQIRWEVSKYRSKGSVTGHRSCPNGSTPVTKGVKVSEKPVRGGV